MRIICPKCQKQYDVPEDRFRQSSDKATMQCAKCKHVFPLTDQGIAVVVKKPRVSHNRLLLGILAVIVVALILMLLAYVALRNDGKLELDKLPEQVEVAIKAEEQALEEEERPREKAKVEPDRLQITLNKGYKLVIKDGNPILVVKGKVHNPGPSKRTRILLEGRVVDTDGNVQFKTRTPCGKWFSNRKLKRTKRGEFSKLFVRNKEYIDCSLAPERTTYFQMIFDDIPPDYDDKYTVEVKPLFSGQEKIEE